MPPVNFLPGITASSAGPIDRGDAIGADNPRAVRLTDGGIYSVTVSNLLI
jgi:hypothetical protein